MPDCASRPRVLFCTQSAYVGGGMEVWLDALTTELARRDWEVVVALAKGAHFHDPQRYLAHHLQEHDAVSLMHLDGTRGFRECRMEALVRCFERARPDVILPVGLADVGFAVAAWKVMKPTAARLVTCVHGDTPEVLADTQSFRDALDCVVSVSRRGAQGASQVLDLDASRVKHIPTGVEVPLQPREGWAEGGSLNVAYIGRLTQTHKRVLDLPPVIREVEERGCETVRWHVVGHGPEAQHLHCVLEAQVRRGSVEFHGQLSPQEMRASLWPRLDVLLVLSDCEGGPIVAWEALAHGVIPVVSDFRGRAEEGVLVRGDNAFVFPVGDIGGAADCVATLARSKREGGWPALRSTLPVDYTRERFGSAWNQTLRACLEWQLRLPTGMPGRQVSSGRLSALGLGWRGSARLRRTLAMRARGMVNAGDEWPHAYAVHVHADDPPEILGDGAQTARGESDLPQGTT